MNKRDMGEDAFGKAYEKLLTINATNQLSIRRLEVGITNLRGNLQESNMVKLADKLKDYLIAEHPQPDVVEAYYAKVEETNQKILNSIFSIVQRVDITAEAVVAILLSTNYHKALPPAKLLPLINLFALRSDREHFNAITDADYERWIATARQYPCRENAGLSNSIITSELLTNMDCYENLTQMLVCDFPYLTCIELAMLRDCLEKSLPHSPLSGVSGFAAHALNEAKNLLIAEAAMPKGEIGNFMATRCVTEICDWYELPFRETDTIFAAINGWLLVTPLLSRSGIRLEKINGPRQVRPELRVSINFEQCERRVVGKLTYTSKEGQFIEFAFTVAGKKLIVTKPRKLVISESGVDILRNNMESISENIEALANKLGLDGVLWRTAIDGTTNEND